MRRQGASEARGVYVPEANGDHAVHVDRAWWCGRGRMRAWTVSWFGAERSRACMGPETERVRLGLHADRVGVGRADEPELGEINVAFNFQSSFSHPRRSTAPPPRFRRLTVLLGVSNARQTIAGCTSTPTGGTIEAPRHAELAVVEPRTGLDPHPTKGVSWFRLGRHANVRSCQQIFGACAFRARKRRVRDLGSTKDGIAKVSQIKYI